MCVYIYIYIVGSITGPYFALCWVNNWATVFFLIFFVVETFSSFCSGNEIFEIKQSLKKQFCNKHLGSIAGPHVPQKI